MTKQSIESHEKQFGEVLNQIKKAKQRAFQQINESLVQLYWTIGEYITTQVEQAGWGKGVIKELARYIAAQDPELKGFSDKNLWRMKQFYETYKQNKKLATLWRELSWSHNRRIMSLKSPEEREFYLFICNQKRYSVRELERLIKSSSFERTMLGNKKLSPVMGDLPQSTDSIFKDSYVFEFLNLPTPHKEKELQTALVASLKDFILELGAGFTFMGQEYRLQVGNEDFAIDLLFFHRKLQCMVAFEIKNRKFKPVDLGQLEFYLEVLDQDIKLPHENQSIGILLCREKDDEVVKYALNRSISPTVIADYETKLIHKELLRCKLNEFYSLLEREDK
jgi:predicted nuclease of restriction endonuclease-like (RecB) superfamily